MIIEFREERVRDVNLVLRHDKGTSIEESCRSTRVDPSPKPEPENRRFDRLNRPDSFDDTDDAVDHCG